ncbi:MAG: hypothetical protein IE927_03680 [Rhodobacterales bacterium]|nr:hypothetical protein [Rhodobacterales bacterium]
MRAALPPLAALALVACGPVSVEMAEAQCLDRARLAEGPQVDVTLSVGSGGTRTGLAVGVSTDYLAGRDPAAVYDRCIWQLTGQPPRLPCAAMVSHDG